MDQLSNTGVPHSNFPPHRPVDEHSKTGQPGTQAGHLAWRPSRATAGGPTWVQPVPEDVRQAVLSERPGCTGALSCPQKLPVLVLEKIFSYLPFSSLCRCARVCRHWHDCLPSYRRRLIQWLKEEQPVSYRAGSGWGQGFDSRTRACLQATNHPLLPVLTQLLQEQEQEQRQKEHDQRLKPAACHLLSSLVHYGLSQQRALIAQQTLRPIAIDWPEGITVTDFLFSPCSRWLAMLCAARASLFAAPGPAFLQLYGWGQGVWHKCQLFAGASEPVEQIMFALTPPETLLSIQGLDILTWRREPDTNNWYATLVHRFPPSHTIHTLYPMANGDQVVLTCRTQEAKRQMMLSCCRTGDGTEAETVTTPIPFNRFQGNRVNCTWSANPRASQLAVALARIHPDGVCFTNAIQIWRAGLNRSRPARWGYQQSSIAWHQAPIDAISYSPGGHYLLGMLGDGRACLWALDAQGQLQEQLSLAGCLYQRVFDLSSLAPFSSDEKQLALPCLLQEIQLCYSDANGRWHCGERLSTPPRPDELPGNRLKAVLLTSSGRTLVRKTQWSLDIWHRASSGSWQHLLARTSTMFHRFPLQACLLQPGDLVCTTAEDPELSLWIHRPNPLGQLVKITCMPLQVPVRGIDAASPDGLSLLLGTGSSPPTLLQLDLPTQEDTGSRAQSRFPGTVCNDAQR
ncbi:MAG: F-box-like domain-containing protein [Kistimonas sp.]|nr:F-box-like domain-containing protein [Kistimonas sp.]